MRFAHIADTHIRNLKYHFEYREVFRQLYQSIKKSDVDYIVHCGDIAHTKTQISPEFVDLCREFFVNLSEVAPTYIILGNHDGNLRNSSRQDAITPIVKAINSPNLFLLKNAGEVTLNSDVCLNVLSVFDEDNWEEPSNPDVINIALYHGAISKSKTDQNWSLSGDHDISIFDNFDFAFLGDIHKTQKLDEKGRIRYAGSTVQQNFGESLEKGYLLWDIKNKEDFSVEHITFENPKPFITLSLTKKGNLPRLTPPTGARLRIVSDSNVSLDKVRKAVDVAKYRYRPESVTYLNRAAGKQITIDASGGFEKRDLRDLNTQEELIREYLKEYDVTDEIFKRVLELNKKYNSHIEESEDTMRNIYWSLQSLEWDNLFNYGEGNSIDFTKLEGIVGIFGKNYSGKSSIVDSLLYTMYNSTSKSIRKNLNIINQNQNTCHGRAIIRVNDTDYVIERDSEKYTKRLHGITTLEAKTDLEFYKKDLADNTIELNGTSRQDTDKNIRKLFGSLEDFLLTSMSSQLDSLSFVNEGSTKRKEILAKFLDLEIFDKKFKMAKEDSSITNASLKRLEGIDFEGQIGNIKSQITKSELEIERNKAVCAALKEHLFKLNDQLIAAQEKIDSVPAEIIDPVRIEQEIEGRRSSILRLASERKSAMSELENSGQKFEKLEDFVSQFDISSYKEKKSMIDSKRDQLENLLKEIKEENEEKIRNIRKQDLLSEVPCGSQYPTCKFIKDAHAASDLIQISENKMQKFSKDIDQASAEIGILDPQKIEQHIDKYNQLVEKRNDLATSVASSKLRIERVEASLFREQVALEQLENKSAEYKSTKEKEGELEFCENKIMDLHKKSGALEQELKQTEELSIEYETLQDDFAAFHLLMVCCHPNGVAYDIIKERLPIINQEIAKILTNIVDFEIFIENDDKKLDIFIKHPQHDPRPLEMGSGAEKTIASMAIRLAFLTVSSLPKSDLFILDEPGTALDEENMEGFVRILEMVKGYFKTVILISHLDNLKDCVDMQINIERKAGCAHVNI